MIIYMGKLIRLNPFEKYSEYTFFSLSFVVKDYNKLKTKKIITRKFNIMYNYFNISTYF